MDVNEKNKKIKEILDELKKKKENLKIRMATVPDSAFEKFKPNYAALFIDDTEALSLSRLVETLPSYGFKCTFSNNFNCPWSYQIDEIFEHIFKEHISKEIKCAFEIGYLIGKKETDEKKVDKK